MLIVTARISRFNVGAALGTHHQPCYLRVQVTDGAGRAVPQVEVTYKARATVPTTVTLASSGANATSSQRREGFKSYLARLTTAHTSINGLCIPTGCRDEGLLSAYRPGQSLLLLEPEVPPPGMGVVVEHRISSINRHQPTTRLNVTSLASTSSHTSYFGSKRACDETRAGLMTYVFRDPGPAAAAAQDGSQLGRYSVSRGSGAGNRVIRTFGASRPPRLTVRFCHFKIGIRFAPGFFASANRTRAIEAVTFANGSSASARVGSGERLTMLGWRTIAVEPGDDGDDDGATERSMCVDYRCGDSRVHLESNPFVYITTRYTDRWTSSSSAGARAE
ncbi:MAG: hypothetical protein AAFP26_14100, partial [Planctomycetota bacterium]